MNGWQQTTRSARGWVGIGAIAKGIVLSGGMLLAGTVIDGAMAVASPLVLIQTLPAQPQGANLTERLDATGWHYCTLTDARTDAKGNSIPPQGAATILPTTPQAQILSQWQTPRPTPAIVATPQTARLGWQWGASAISTAPTDVAALQQLVATQGIAVQPRDDQTGTACADWVERDLSNADLPNSDLPSNALADHTVAVAETHGSGETATPLPNALPLNTSGPNTMTPTVAPQAVRTQEQTAVVPLASDSAFSSLLLPKANKQASELSANPTPIAPVSQRELSRLLAAAPNTVRQQYLNLNQLVNRYESAVIAVESHRFHTDDTTFSETVQQLGQPGQVAPLLPENLQQVRQELRQILNLLANKNYRQVNARIEQLERLIWQRYPLEQPISHAASRAMWLDRGTIVRTRSERDLARIFNRLADAGINTVFFETLNASYPIYPSQVAPEQNPLTQGWDPLEAAVKLAHERGMELHAWVWIFAAANQRHNAILGQPQNYLGPVLSRNPDWAMYDRRGNAFQPNSRKAFYDPANPEVRAYLLEILDEIASRYAVDGIQLDYIRYPFQDPRTDLTFGYGIAARRQFHHQTGVDPATIRPSDGRWRQWTQFRMQQVSEFVESASQLLQEQHPDVLLSAAVFPFPAHERLAKLQQNWETWLDQDYLDFLVPMTYAQSTAEFETLTAPVLNHNQRGSTLLLPGIRLLQLPTVGTIDQLQHLQDRATGGYALFATENLSLTLQSSLRSRHGRQTSRSSEPIAHRQPLPTALTRYQALQNEWQYWLAHQQLQLPPQTLTQWATAAAELETQLLTASQTPSAANRRQAQRALSEFQRQFDRWLEPVATETPYRVQVWQQRLLGIEQLLRYSERRS
ncbi:MAG: family 10 glycosylhydrolase [Cyanobacteria bacterium P01_G01_bin.54]